MDEKKFYEKTWFIIAMVILFGPIGLLLLWKRANFKKQTNIIIGSVICLILLVGLITSEKPIVAETEYQVTSNAIVYTTETIPATEAVYEDAKTYSITEPGIYYIDVAPMYLVSGTEEEFTTAQSGVYVAGEDFEPGMYDLEVVSGKGNVFGPDLNEIMGTQSGSYSDMYAPRYQNQYFESGEQLEVSGVSIKLVPQDQDSFYIPNGKYTLIATKGGGNVIGSGLNEIMGIASKGDMYVPSYDNATMESAEALKITGVSLDFKPVEDKVLVKEAQAEIPGSEVTEKIYVYPDREVCYKDDEVLECAKLEKYDELKADLSSSETIKESVSYLNDEYTCYENKTEIDCSLILNYDQLKAEIDKQL